MQHQAADFSRRVIAEVSRADTSEVVYLLRCMSPEVALLYGPAVRCKLDLVIWRRLSCASVSGP